MESNPNACRCFVVAPSARVLSLNLQGQAQPIWHANLLKSLSPVPSFAMQTTSKLTTQRQTTPLTRSDVLKRWKYWAGEVKSGDYETLRWIYLTTREEVQGRLKDMSYSSEAHHFYWFYWTVIKRFLGRHAVHLFIVEWCNRLIGSLIWVTRWIRIPQRISLSHVQGPPRQDSLS